MKLLKDEEMRPLLFEYFETSNTPVRFLEEFCLGRKTRADALFVTPTELLGFEFKSDRDNLDRLLHQVKDYERFCDRNYLVVGKKLQKKALELLPEHWGIYLIYVDDQEQLQMEHLRPAQFHKKPMRLHNQLRLLWRSELIPIVKKYSLGGVTKKNKLELVRTLEHHLTKEQLKAELTEALLQRDYTIYQED